MSLRFSTAAQERRRLLSGRQSGIAGRRSGSAATAMLVREFLHKNFVPFTWYESAIEQAGLAWPGRPLEVAEGRRMQRRSLALQSGAGGSPGGWRVDALSTSCRRSRRRRPGGRSRRNSAAVYAAKGYDRARPSVRQSGGSSKIENFIGFPNRHLRHRPFQARSVCEMLREIQGPIPTASSSRIAGRDAGDHHICAASRLRNLLRAQDRLDRCGRAFGSGSRRSATPERLNRPESTTHHLVEAMLYDNAGRSPWWRPETPRAGRDPLPNAPGKRRVHLVIRPAGPGVASRRADRRRANICVHEGSEIACGGSSRQQLDSMFARRIRPGRRFPAESG